MALENLEPAVRMEEILDGQDIEPATRLEYFLKKAAEGGGGSSGEYPKVYDSTELLSETIQVVSDIDGQTMIYTSGMTVLARDVDNNTIHCVLSDTSVLNSPIVVLFDESGFKYVFLPDSMFNNTDDINPITPPANANSEEGFYVKEILPNCKVTAVTNNNNDDTIFIADANYVTLGYGYTQNIS